MSKENVPFIGVAGIVIKNGKVLLCRRKGNHGGGTWAPPGGRLEYGEEFEDAVKRELEEEVGIKVKGLRFASVTNNIFRKEGRHSITLFFTCRIKSGTPRIMEPDKCEAIGWFEWKRLPKPLFVPVQRLLEQGFRP
ncbi:MAG: NUDIX domain-containing protein [Candidatus Micrarchaeota archaeon]|nr:NUDIX domain-containing protein [Candidatus Micrarchaeota archaeon]